MSANVEGEMVDLSVRLPLDTFCRTMSLCDIVGGDRRRKRRECGIQNSQFVNFKPLCPCLLEHKDFTLLPLLRQSQSN